MDLKKKYQEKYRGALYVYKTFYNKHGKLKYMTNPYRKKKEDGDPIHKPEFQTYTEADQVNQNIYL